MSTLAEFMILSGGDNRPPMLEKHLYDYWKSRMELYMQNREHGRMIFESVEHGPLIWPTIKENGVSKTKKYKELTATEKIQADYDLKATNIILQGLPADVYSLEKECKLYDAFDKFAHIKGELLHQYYLRFTQLINVINIYKMKLEQFQVNTKFLNSLPPEWSKFVTDVKLVRDLHTTNFDQLNAYLEQHELYANEVRIMRERNHDPLALVANHQMHHITSTLINLHITIHNSNNSFHHLSLLNMDQFIPHNITQLLIHPHLVQLLIHQHLNQQTHLVKFPQIDSGLAIPVFKQGDDPINAINKMMSFLSTVVTSHFPTTNNQLRNSSNPRQQATIHDGMVTVQLVQGRQSLFAAGTFGTRATISGTERNNSGQQRVVKCFNCQGEGHMSRQCLKPKRKRDATWFRNKVLLVEEQGSAKAVLMANLSSYGSNVLSEVPHSENNHNDMLNQTVQEMSYSEQTHLVNYPENEITSYSNIIPYSQYLLETQNAAVHDTNSSTQQDVMILYVFEQLSNQENELLTVTFNVLKNESKEKETKNIDKEIALEKKLKELDNIVYKMGQSAQTVHMLTKPQVFYDNNLKQALGFQNSFYLKKAQ
ncbi:retrovirus-related pol polyprotein from transposon TNT 1-94 [Tanacetum coccineum]